MRPRLLTTLALASAVFGTAVFAPACSNALDQGTDDGELVGGETSGTEDDAVVLLVRDGKPLCTATLIAPNVLVTAHHCVGRLQNAATGAARASITPFQPSEITVRMGSTPADKASAVVTKIFAPATAVAEPTPATSPVPEAGTLLPDGGVAPIAPASTRGLEGADIAALLVQPLDPAFERIAPRRVRQEPVVETDTVGVVGWNGTGTEMRLGAIRRMKRSGVDVLADSTQRIAVQSPSLEGIAVTNQAREFVTEAVACKGDDGAPAFDLQNNLVGFAAAVVGPCAAGSLSVFTDLAAHKAFISSVLSEVQRLACSADSKCGGPGKICDTSTFTCREGCRTGSVACTGGLRCSNPSETTAGLSGLCSASGPGTNLDGGYVPPTTDYDSGTYPSTTSDGGTSSGGCTDRSCGGTIAAPKACNAARTECVAGCRVGDTPSMCGAGYDCKAGAADPTLGTCEARSISAPPPPALSLPTRPNETAGGGGVTTGDTPGGGTETGDAGKKNKAKKAADEGGCSVGNTGSGSSASAFGLLAAAFAFVAMRRRKRSA